MENMISTFSIPTRQGVTSEVGKEPPQLQFSDQSPPEILNQLAEWAFSAFEGVREEPTRISVPTSRALWLDEQISHSPPDAFMPPLGSREFCHLHQDGSIHAVVSSAVEQEIINKGWGVLHPWHHRGVKEILVYAPRNEEEVEILKTVISKSYEYAIGKETS